MARFGIPRRASDMQVNERTKAVNWRRGLIRVWLLLSAAWIMGWAVYLILFAIRVGFENSRELLANSCSVVWTADCAFTLRLSSGLGFSRFQAR